jgi:hypothetical protein
MQIAQGGHGGIQEQAQIPCHLTCQVHVQGNLFLAPTYKDLARHAQWVDVSRIRRLMI